MALLEREREREREAHSPSLLDGTPEREAPARMRQPGLGSWAFGFTPDEAKAVEGFGIGVVGRVFHLHLLRDDDPVICRHVGAVREGEGCHDLSRHADCGTTSVPRTLGIRAEG